jgi:hypothetical protein
VDPAPEPPGFQAAVRGPGLNAIEELLGHPPSLRRPGPKRTPVAARPEDIPPDAFPPFWRSMLREMSGLYHGLCAYTAMRIGRGVGRGTVDHFVPRAASWQGVYEWDNYRLACVEVNTWKDVHLLPFDPFTLPDRLCALEFVAFQVVPGEGAADRLSEVDRMINQQLRLNARILVETREEYYRDYMNGEYSLRLLERDAPFIARELRRQGMLLPGHA